MKFKIGDRVIMTINGVIIGKGVITEIRPPYRCYKYYVTGDYNNSTHPCHERELKLIDQQLLLFE